MKKTKKLLILVIAVIFCTSCGMFGLSDSAWSEVFEKRNSMPQNSLEEKLKNPEMVYQTVDGKLYFREGGKIDVYEKNSTEKEKITSDVVSYFVYNGKIYYTTTYQMSGKNELRVCDLDGSNDERLTQSVESFCLQNGDDGKLVLVDKMSQDILYSYDLKTRKKEVISCEGGSIAPQYVCFDGDWVFIADDCTISKTNYKTGECVYIWEVPEGKNVNITDVYIHGDKVYFGLYGTDSQTKDDTGLWCVNPDGTDSKKISSDEVNEVCFVGEEYFVR